MQLKRDKLSWSDVSGCARALAALLLAAAAAIAASSGASATSRVVFMPGLSEADLDFMVHEVGVDRLPDFPGLEAAADRMEVVAVDLDRDGRLELFVRFGGHETCEREACGVTVFLRGPTRWHPILRTRGRSIVICRESFQGMPDLLIDASLWRYHERVYRRTLTME